MSRKAFIESQGATCKNWLWSWSFVNVKERFVIFGAWDIHTENGETMILSDDWEFKTGGSRNAGYPQSKEHIRLVAEEGYELRTFPMTYSGETRDSSGYGPAKIKGFVPELTRRRLERRGKEWYAI